MMKTRVKKDYLFSFGLREWTAAALALLTAVLLLHTAVMELFVTGYHGVLLYSAISFSCLTLTAVYCFIAFFKHFSIKAKVTFIILFVFLFNELATHYLIYTSDLPHYAPLIALAALAVFLPLAGLVVGFEGRRAEFWYILFVVTAGLGLRPLLYELSYAARYQQPAFLMEALLPCVMAYTLFVGGRLIGCGAAKLRDGDPGGMQILGGSALLLGLFPLEFILMAIFMLMEPY
ncbi:hypothetical protein LJC32_05725 [Oscillospiraceae bacterium OttesenSCG-928-F05]|nr:hypothetical protein [Oscillospiraceae bacterium OttesenSCG-928-F05]